MDMLLFWVAFLGALQLLWGQDACHQLQHYRFKSCQGHLLHVNPLQALFHFPVIHLQYTVIQWLKN